MTSASATVSIAPSATATATAAPELQPAVRPRSIRWALARVEGRRLLKHPLFLLGMFTSIAALALSAGRIAPGLGSLDGQERLFMLAGDCFVLLGGAIWTFLAAFLATSREGRDAAQDFYAGQPVPARLRTEAALLSLAFVGLAGVGLIAVATPLLVGWDATAAVGPTIDGEPYTLHPFELIQGPLYLVLAGAVGVFAGSWIRPVYAGVFGAFVLFFPPLALLPWFVFVDDVSRGFYGAVMVGGPASGDFAAWALVRLTGLATLVAAGALARHDRRLRIALLALVGLGIAVAGYAFGWPTIGPPP